jgi:Tol biopolymer transport system component
MRKQTWLILTIILLCGCTVTQNKKEKGTETLKNEINVVENENKLIEDKYKILDETNNELRSEIDILNLKLDEIVKENNELIQLIESKKTEQNDKDDILQHYAFKDSDVENNLRKKTDLISAKSLFGGQMRFKDIEVISNSWVYATFGDDNVSGYGIYKFMIIGDDIRWEEIATDCTDQYSHKNSLYRLNENGQKDELFSTIGVYSAPVMSYDGRYVVLNRTMMSGGEASWGYPVLFDLESGETKALLKEAENFMYTCEWFSDSKHVLIDGKYIINIDTGNITELKDKNYNNLGSVPSPDNKYIANLTSKGEEDSKLEIILYNNEWDYVKTIRTDLTPRYSGNLQMQWLVPVTWIGNNFLCVQTADNTTYENIISLIDVASNKVVTIGTKVADMSVSSDNQKIAIKKVIKDSEKSEVIIVDLDGNILTELNENQLGDKYRLVGWSKDSTKLYIRILDYQNMDHEDVKLAIIDINTEETKIREYDMNFNRYVENYILSNIDENSNCYIFEVLY